MSAVAVGADSVTAVVYAGWPPNEKATARLSDDTARRPKAKRLTVNSKIAVDRA